LDANPHFVQPGTSSAPARSSSAAPSPQTFDLSTLDLTKAENRAAYKDALAKGMI
jgi:hypothetical protein